MFLYSGEPQSEEEEKRFEPPEEKEDNTTRRSAVIENVTKSDREYVTMLVENVLKGSSAESNDFSIEMIPEGNCAVVTFSYSKGRSLVVFPSKIYSSDVHAIY